MRSPLGRSGLRARAFGRRGRLDGGFTLIETVVALGIATAVFLALAAASMTGLRASLTSQQNQQAGDVLTQTIEQLRDMTYGRDGLQISSADATLATDGSITSCASASGKCFDPGLGTGTEALQVSSTGQITQHKQTVTTNHYTFTVYLYVTRPGNVAHPGDSYGADYERVTAVVQWTSYGKTHTRRASSMVTDTVRGLPLPRFKLSAVGQQDQTLNPQSQLVYGMKIQNLGARDCWNITPSDTSFSFYVDSDANGFYDDTTDQPLAACPAAGSAFVEPTKNVVIFAVKTLPGTPGTYTQTVTFTATSWAQPGSATASQTLTDSYTVVNGVVTPTPTPTPTGTATPTPTVTPTPTPTPTGTPTPVSCSDFVSGATVPTVPKNYTAIGYWLHNANPNTVDTAALSTMGLDRALPVSSWLYDYSTNLAAATPGRYLQTGGSGASETNPAKVADWRLQVNQMFVSGSAAFVGYAAPADGQATTHGTISVYLNMISSTGTVTPLASGTFDATQWNCPGFRKFGVSLPISGSPKLATNSWIDVRVEVTGSSPMILAYDTTTFPATLAVPEK